MIIDVIHHYKTVETQPYYVNLKTQSMKKILLSLFVLTGIGLSVKVQGQCNLFPANLTVSLTSAVNSGGNCNITADISFDIVHNGGNKKIWINLWKSVDYAFLPLTAGHPSYLDSDMPTLDELNGADNTHAPVAIIGINNDVTPVVYFTSYSADASHITPNTGASVTRTAGPVIGGNPTDHFVLTGVTFSAPGACAGVILQGDIWSTQANGSSPTIHCYASGISFYGDPTVNGAINCGTNRQVLVLLSTVSTSPITVNYTVYVDKGTVGVKDVGDPVAIAQSANFPISSGSSYSSGFMPYTGNNFKPDADLPLLIEVNVVTPFSKTIYGVLTNSCIPLPAQFKTFTAVRNRSNVVLKWETMWEQNCAGFAIERNTNGTWEQVGYVASLAPNGNSGDALSYQHIDVNTNKGISQYRLKQIDIDNRFKYTEVRTVRGESQMGQLIVYPNPTMDGKVNVSFEDAAIRDITVSDMSGRVVRQMKGVSNNNITIENLTPGMYNLLVVIPSTGEQAVAKIVVNKR